MAQQLGPYEYGQIKAHAYHGLGPSEIAKLVVRQDGSQWSAQNIAYAMEKVKSKQFGGERKEGSGAPRKTTKAMDRAIVREVFRQRGRKKVTVNKLKRKFKELRPLGKSLVEDRLHQGGLKYQRRRGKSLVAEFHKPSRVAYCNWVKRLSGSYLSRWMYTDGAAWYLDETQDDVQQTQRRALGPMVWRKADGSDSLDEDVIGPNLYRKSQGPAVKVWGLLSEGKFRMHVLPHGQNMDRFYYAELIEDFVDKHRGNCDLLVQDFEKCLRSEEPREAMRAVGIQMVIRYPKVSQDLNPVENCWNILRDRLYETQPTGKEARDQFIERLKKAVAWLNRSKAQQLADMCMCQKQRAEGVLAKNGGRTKW